MPHSSPHLTHHLPLIELRHFPFDIRPSIAGIEARSAAGVEHAEELLQCTVRAAAASLYLPYFLYADPRRPQAPPASGELPDPLVTPPLRLYPRQL